mgnify:CR=1 FL=1
MNVLRDLAEDGGGVALIDTGMQLVGVPRQVHIVTRYQKRRLIHNFKMQHHL